MTTEGLYKLIEGYLFAFPSTEDVLREVFDNNIEFYASLAPEKLEEKINENLARYFKKQFEEEKLPEIIIKYIETKGKALSKRDVNFIDNIIIESGYELSYEDIPRLLQIKELVVYINVVKDDKTTLLEQIKEFQEIQEIEKEISKSKSTGKRDYDGEDIEQKYYSDISQYRLLTPEEQRYYLKKYQEEDDPEALDILVGSNQGLCRAVANRYVNRGLPFLDLIQEGNIGLINAIKRFDLNKKTRLSTYAMWWIKQGIKRALDDQSRTVRIPTHLVEAQEKIRKVSSSYESKTGREPTVEELVELTGLNKDQVQKAIKYDLKPVYLDKPIDNGDGEEDSVLGDYITDDTIEPPEEAAITQSVHDDYEFLIGLLGKDEKLSQHKRIEQIIRLRFGQEWFNEVTYAIIEGHGMELKYNYTLEEVKTIYKVSRERIRQLEAKGLRKMNVYAKRYKKLKYAE